MDEQRLRALEVKVERLDRLVYRLFALVKQVMGYLRPLLHVLEDAKS